MKWWVEWHYTATALSCGPFKSLSAALRYIKGQAKANGTSCYGEPLERLFIQDHP
jgi:hypothetical protein